jgi:molybdenum cofactor biosynthesis enzyme MoaA
MHDKFCSVPWLDLNVSPTGHFGLCCSADHNDMNDLDRVSVEKPIEMHWNSNFMKSIRQEFMSGSIPSICKNCVRDESVGIMSRRQRMNQRYVLEQDPSHDNIRVKELLLSTKDDGSSMSPLQGLDLSLGDTCQIRCIQCSPSYSRSISKDYEKLGWNYNDKNRLPIQPEFRVIKQDHAIASVLENVKQIIHDVRYIKFIGGEPSITKPLLQFMDWCIENDHARNTVLLLNTNAVTISDRFIKQLQQFQRVLLAISVDGVEQLDEWIRYPTNWHRKTNNIHRLMQSFPDAYITTVLFNLNIHGLPDLIDWCRSNNYRHTINRLNWPEPFSLQHLPDNEKQNLSNILAKYAENLPEDQSDDRLLADRQYRKFISAIIEFMMTNPRDPSQWQQCQEIVKSYNEIRPMRLQDCSPQWNQLLLV